MIRIYEALDQAAQHRGEDVQATVLPSQATCRQDSGALLSMDREMLELYQAIESFLPNRRNRIIQFIGSREGEGTSTICREFARVSALKVGKSVLLLDADLSKERQKRRSSAAESCRGCIEVLKSGRDIEEAMAKQGKEELYISFLSENGRLNPEIFDADLVDSFWSKIKERFDLVVIDSAPLTATPDGLALASRVDGVVLVVESERTRWKISESVKERITQVGGNVLGIVFNKRRFHIPYFIYKRLG